jgi:hypothetical protein
MKSTRDVLLAQKEALLSQIRTKMPEIAAELESTLQFLAALDGRPDAVIGTEFLGMQIIDAISIYFKKLERPQSEEKLIEDLIAGGAGMRSKKRPAWASIKESIRLWSSKGRLIRKDGLVWPSEWGSSPPGL